MVYRLPKLAVASLNCGQKLARFEIFLIENPLPWKGRYKRIRQKMPPTFFLQNIKWQGGRPSNNELTFPPPKKPSLNKIHQQQRGREREKRADLKR